MGKQDHRGFFFLIRERGKGETGTSCRFFLPKTDPTRPYSDPTRPLMSGLTLPDFDHTPPFILSGVTRPDSTLIQPLALPDINKGRVGSQFSHPILVGSGELLAQTRPYPTQFQPYSQAVNLQPLNVRGILISQMYPKLG